MNDALAHERLVGVLNLIDKWGDLYNRRWGKKQFQEEPALAGEVDALIDDVRKRTMLAHAVIKAMGEHFLAAKVVEHKEGLYGPHPFTQARVAIVEAIAILAQREELAEIVGPVGLGSLRLNCIKLSGELLRACGMTVTSAQRFRPPRLPSKASCRA